MFLLFKADGESLTYLWGIKMNQEAKSILLRLVVCIAASLVLLVAQASANTLFVTIFCKVANAALTLWFVWLLVKLLYQGIKAIWRTTTAKIKSIFSKKTVNMTIEKSITRIDLNVQKKPNQLLYEHDFEDTYQYGR